MFLISEFDNICYSITLKYYKVLGVDFVLPAWNQISKINGRFSGINSLKSLIH